MERIMGTLHEHVRIDTRAEVGCSFLISNWVLWFFMNA
jgi:hypothetical protein